MTAESQGPRSGSSASRRARVVTLNRLWEGVEELVSGSHLFKTLDDASRRELADKGNVLVFPAGKTIIREGEAGDSFYMIDQGVVEVMTTAPSGPVTLATLQRGAFFGEVAVLTGLPRTATVTSLTDVCLVEFEKPAVDEVLSRNPDARRLLEAVVLGRARDTAEKVSRAGTAPPPDDEK